MVLIGGTVTVPSTANQTDNGNDGTDTAIYIRHSTGIVHIEGVLISGDPNVMFDGIDVNAPLATVQVENVRMIGVWGSQTSEHADAIQTWGGVRALRVDHLTADGDYQGLSINPDLGAVGSATIQNVDLTDDLRPSSLAAQTVGGGYMIWLTRGNDTCDATPTSFTNVFVANQTNRLASSNTIFPPSQGTSLPCAASLQNDQVSWPDLPVTGFVTLSPPPNGPFVPNGIAGLNYSSPSYASSPAGS